jgi:long-subunit acyl-CoA synthetase (AMP-forming)
MKGYLKNAKATEEHSRAAGSTGDLAVMQPDGYIRSRTARRT